MSICLYCAEIPVHSNTWVCSHNSFVPIDIPFGSSSATVNEACKKPIYIGSNYIGTVAAVDPCNTKILWLKEEKAWSKLSFTKHSYLKRGERDITLLSDIVMSAKALQLILMISRIPLTYLTNYFKQHS